MAENHCASSSPYFSLETTASIGVVSTCRTAARMQATCAAHTTVDSRSIGASHTIPVTRTVESPAWVYRIQDARSASGIDSAADAITTTVTRSAIRAADRTRWWCPRCGG